MTHGCLQTREKRPQAPSHTLNSNLWWISQFLWHLLDIQLSWKFNNLTLGFSQCVCAARESVFRWVQLTAGAKMSSNAGCRYLSCTETGDVHLCHSQNLASSLPRSLRKIDGAGSRFFSENGTNRYIYTNKTDLRGKFVASVPLPAQ